MESDEEDEWQQDDECDGICIHICLNYVVRIGNDLECFRIKRGHVVTILPIVTRVTCSHFLYVSKFV